MIWLQVTWLHALWVVPVLAIALRLAHSGRARAQRRFLTLQGAERVGPLTSWVRVFLRGGLLLGAVACVALGLARPGIDPTARKVSRMGRDVVFLLDVSRSMLARDLAPNRLERAKLMITDAMRAARESGGDRVGVIVFAGASQVICPLTMDYSFAEVATDAASPDIVPKGGTLIGDAIRDAMSLFFPRTGDSGEPAGADPPVERRTRDIILITDGEDHDSFPRDAAVAAGERGVRLIAVGIGSDSTGSTVPGADGAELVHEGEVVRSRMDAASLRSLAESTPGGVFLKAGTGNLALDEVYRKIVRSGEQAEREDAESVRYTEMFQIFLGAALVLLMVEGVLHEKR